MKTNAYNDSAGRIGVSGKNLQRFKERVKQINRHTSGRSIESRFGELRWWQGKWCYRLPWAIPALGGTSYPLAAAWARSWRIAPTLRPRIMAI